MQQSSKPVVCLKSEEKRHDEWEAWRAGLPVAIDDSAKTARVILWNSPIDLHGYFIGLRRESLDRDRQRRERNIAALYRSAPSRFDGDYNPHNTGELRVAAWECSLPTFRGCL